MTEGPIDLNIH